MPVNAWSRTLKPDTDHWRSPGNSDRRLGVDPIPPARTIERIIAAAGLARPRRRGQRYVSKGVPYPVRSGAEPGATHQIDMVGPRHLDGGIGFHACNLIDVGSHRAANHILDSARPVLIAGGIAAMWAVAGTPKVAQFDNHTNFRGAIPTAGNYRHFGPVGAMCLDLDITPRFIPLREPWRNGVIEHLRLPARGHIEVIRYIRSNRLLALFGKKILLAEDQTHQYVTSIIKVRAKKVIVINIDGEIIHRGDYDIARTLH